MNFFQEKLQSFGDWLGRVIQCVREFYRPLEDLRIIVLCLLAGGFALIYLDQGRDVVRGLVDAANAVFSWPPQSEVIPVVLRWIIFMLACVWSGINAWYWANLLYKTRPGVDEEQPRWFLYVRRAFGVLPLIAALIAMPLSTRHGIKDTWLGMLFFAAATALLLWFFTKRTTWFTATKAPRANRKVDTNDNIVQGDLWFIRTTLIVSAVALAVLLIPGLRTEFAWFVGPAAIAYGAIGCIIPVTSWLILKTRNQHIPVVLLGGLAFVAFSIFNDNHRVRDINVAGATIKRPTMEEALRRWEKGRDPSEPVILVATAGGASRAAYWTGTVLRALDDRSNGKFSDRVFAISSVSGGALGAIGYAAWLADRPMESEANAFAAEARLNFVQNFFGQDYLGPSVGALLFPDMIQRFLPIPLLPDRAASLEEAFELGWKQSAAECKHEPCQKPTRFAEEYTRIWSNSRLHEASDRWVPIVLANGTHVETGKRIITAPVQIDASVFEDAYDFYKLAPAPIRASTAVLNSARFTVVSPPGRLVQDGKTTGRIIDGGYFENGGMETVYDVARYLRHTMQPADRPMIIIEILNDDTMSDDDLRRHSENAPVPVEPPKSEWRSPLLLEITSIVGGLYHTRSARGVLAAKRLSDGFGSGLGNSQFYSFDLRPLNNSWHTAMSWALSLGTRDAMDVALNTTEKQIDTFLSERNYSTSMKRTLTADLLEAVANSKANNQQLDFVLNALNVNVKPQGDEAVTAAKRK